MSENLEPTAREAFEKHLDQVMLTTKGKITEKIHPKPPFWSKAHPLLRK